MVKQQNKTIKYHRSTFNPSILDKDNIDRLVVDRIRPESYVLDIGCGTGFVGEYLRHEKQCKVVGLNLSKKEAGVAKLRLNDVIIGDIEDNGTIKKIISYTKIKKFDIILMMSLIEHLKNPDQLLQKLPKLLRKGGVCIVTTPNIAHWTMRIALLRGNFDYTEYGILDNSHLRFFTTKTFQNLFTNNGFMIKDFAIDSTGGGIPRISRFFSRFFPRIFAYQLLIVAKAK